MAKPDLLAQRDSVARDSLVQQLLELLQSLRVGGSAPARGALITADHGVALTERASNLGYKVLRKPIKPAALRALLGALLASARQEPVVSG